MVLPFVLEQRVKQINYMLKTLTPQPKDKPSSHSPSPNKKPEPTAQPPAPSKPLITQLTDESLTSYLKYFLTINEYKTIDQGRDLIKLINQQTNPQIVEKSMQLVCYFIEHANPEGKVCGMQFLKEVMELGKLKVFLVVEKKIIKMLIDVVEYRNSVKSLARGSTYFMTEIDKNQKQSKIGELVRLSNTFFRMGHEILYVWGTRYFPHSHFGIVYKKLSKYCLFPEFPTDFKFYREDKVNQIAKKQSIVEIDNFLSNRKNVEVPALSSRSKKSIDKPLQSGRSAKNQKKSKEPPGQINSKPSGHSLDNVKIKETNNNVDAQSNTVNKSPISNKITPNTKLVTNPVVNSNISINLDQKINGIDKKADSVTINSKEYKDKEEQRGTKEKVQAEQGQEQENIFETQSRNNSVIFKKSQKIVLKPSKSSEKIPRNFIYRESSIEDPSDSTKQFPKLGKLKTGQGIDLPLGVIPEVTTQEGSSKQKSKQNSRDIVEVTQIPSEQKENKLSFKKKISQNIQPKKLSSVGQSSKSPDSERVGIDIDQSSQSSKKVDEQNEENITSLQSVNQKIKNIKVNKIESQPRILTVQPIILQSQPQKPIVPNTKKPSAQQSPVSKQAKPIKPNKQPITSITSKPVRKQNYTLESVVEVIKKQRSKEKIQVQTVTVEELAEIQRPKKLPGKNDDKKIINQDAEITFQRKTNYISKNKTEASASKYNKQQAQPSKITVQPYGEELPSELIKKAPKLNMLEPSSTTRQPQQLGLQSEISSNTSRQKSSKFKAKKFTLQNNLHKKRRKSQVSWQDEEAISKIHSFTKNPRKLAYHNAYDVKELGQATSLMDKIKSDHKLQEDLESNRKLLSQRKLRKFRQITVTYIPDQQHQLSTLQNQIQNKNSQIKGIKQQLTDKIDKLEQARNIKADLHLSEIKELLKKQMQDISQKINTNTTTQANTYTNTNASNTLDITSKIDPYNYKSDRKQKQSSFFNEDRVHHPNRSTSKIKSNSSKRSSLSQIKNKAEASYEEGTLLYYLAQRRSVIM